MPAVGVGPGVETGVAPRPLGVGVGGAVPVAAGAGEVVTAAVADGV